MHRWLVLDCAHTALSMRALCTNLEEAFPSSKIAIILAIAADKDLAAVASCIGNLNPELVICTTVAIGGQNYRSTDPGAVRQALKAAIAGVTPGGRGLPEAGRLETQIADDMRAALQQALAWSEREASRGTSTVVCTTGSNYAVGALQNLLAAGSS